MYAFTGVSQPNICGAPHPKSGKPCVRPLDHVGRIHRTAGQATWSDRTITEDDDE